MKDRIPNLQVAARFLRRMAPMQTHEGRKDFQEAARLLEGPVITPENEVTLYNLPVNVNGTIKGFVWLWIDKTGVRVEFRDDTDVPPPLHVIATFVDDEPHREMSDVASPADQFPGDRDNKDTTSEGGVIFNDQEES